MHPLKMTLKVFFGRNLSYGGGQVFNNVTHGGTSYYGGEPFLRGGGDPLGHHARKSANSCGGGGTMNKI